MNPKTYLSVSGGVFGVVAIMHALRMVLGWDAMIGGWSFPMWTSGLALLLSGFLAYTAYSLRKTAA
jgi:hypothetical protein